MDLTNYVSQKKDSGLLLEGSPGLSMKEDALVLAGHLLHSAQPTQHPDFLMVAPMNGKTSIHVEDILPLIHMGSHPPFHCSKSIAIIDGMEKLTVAAQNKLLVLLETNEQVFVIGIAYAGGVLDTVRSRMRSILYRGLSKSEFSNVCGLPADESLLFYHITGGCPGLLADLLKEKKMLKQAAIVCQQKEGRSSLFQIFHLVKEKDKLSITEQPKLMLYAIRSMQFGFQEQMRAALKNSEYDIAAKCAVILGLLNDEEVRCMQPSYSKHDFFNTVVFLYREPERMK